MARHICEECGLQYRYESDFEEHRRVGCRIESSDGPTWSNKDGEEKEENETPQE